MAWCPKCKTEYREGFTVCADCGSELVSAEAFRKIEKQQYIKSQLDGADMGTQPEDADKEKPVLAEKYAQENANENNVMSTINLAEGAKLPEGMTPEQAQTIMSQLQAAEMIRKSRGGASRYQSSANAAEENRSSAWLLMFVGIVGFIVIILGFFNVLPINFKNQMLFFGVMAVLFLFFIAAGISSLRNAKEYDKRAVTENTLRNTLVEWVRDNLNSEEIDKMAGVSVNVPEEVAYFRRYDCIKYKLNHQFVNLDQNFLDQFIDEYVYDAVYSADEE